MHTASTGESHRAALRLLRTVLPAYAPGARGSKRNRFQKDDWKDISRALDALEYPVASISTEKFDNTDSGTKLEHCVHCHRNYAPGEYGARCEIPHVFSEDGQLWGPDVRRHEAECCDAGAFVLDENCGDHCTLDAVSRQPYVTLKHTTDPKEVEYNDINVVECTEEWPDGKCDLEWLKMKDTLDAPVFA